MIPRKINDVKINFDLDNSIVNDYNSMYNDVSDEFVGIKRFNVFRYFEDTNMLLPIETFHDVPNNRVYAHYNEMGTYCLIDMTKWLDSLGYMDNSDQSAMTFAMERTAEATESNSIDVVFLLYAQPAQAAFIKEELTNVVNTVYDNANDVHMYFMINDGSDVIPYMTSGRGYAQTKAEALAITNRLTFPVSNSVYLYKGFKAVSELTLRDDAQKHLFLIDGVFEPKTDTENVFLKRILDKNVNFGVVCDVVNSNLAYYRSISEGNVKNSHIVFSSFITDQISFPIDTEKDYIITSNGLMAIPENFGKISADSTQDYDEDGLPDITEINFGVTGENGNTLITVNADGSVVLPCFNECVYAGGTYVESGLKRFYDKADNSVLEFLDEIRVLPISSAPTSPDGDGDGILDSDEHGVCDSEITASCINEALYTNHIVNLKANNHKSTISLFKDDKSTNTPETTEDNLVDQFFITNISGVVIDSDGNVDNAYPLAPKFDIANKNKEGSTSYGILGNKNDAFYLEAYAFINDKNNVESYLSINVNVRFTEKKMTLNDKTEVSKNEIMRSICEKWGKTYTSENQYDFSKGMKIETSIVFNLISPKTGSTNKIRNYDYLKNQESVSEDNTLTKYAYFYFNDGSIPKSNNSDGDYNNKCDETIKRGHAATTMSFDGNPQVYLYCEESDGELQTKEKILQTSAHEFGHVLGIEDAYGKGNPKNYFMEPISRLYKTDEIYYQYGYIFEDNGKKSFESYFGTENGGEMMHRNGIVSANDIEMVLYAAKNKETQSFVPEGRTCRIASEGSEKKYQTLETFSISPAVKQEYIYICMEEDPDENFYVVMGEFYYYDYKEQKYVKVDFNSDASDKLIGLFGRDYYEYCKNVYVNKKYYYPPEWF